MRLCDVSLVLLVAREGEEGLFSSGKHWWSDRFAFDGRGNKRNVSKLPQVCPTNLRTFGRRTSSLSENVD
jgi:hypothetical protein